MVNEKFKAWRESNEGLTFADFKRKYYPDEPKALEQESQEVITQSPNNITQLPPEIQHKKLRVITCRATIPLFRKLEDYAYSKNLTLSEAIFEILSQHLEGKPKLNKSLPLYQRDNQFAKEQEHE